LEDKPIDIPMVGIIRILKAVLHSMTSRQTVRTFTSAPNVADLETLASMAEAGTIRPVIDQVYPFERAAEAMAHVASRHARGKVVVRVAPNDAGRERCREACRSPSMSTRRRYRKVTCLNERRGARPRAQR
jgi:hypothetical protein